MSAAELISRINGLKPNPYGENLEYFIKALDLRIRKELLLESNPVYLRESLALSEPYDTLYLLNLIALIDYLNGDFASFENTSAQFNLEWDKISKMYAEKSKSDKRSFKIW